MGRLNTSPEGSTTTKPGGWLAALEQSQKPNELWSLPQEFTDPFASLQRRLIATLDSYRYSKAPRNLIDWAEAQTGLADPMTKYTRQDLEQAFDRFDRDRTLHLRDLVRQAKQQSGDRILKQLRRTTPWPTARSALEKALNS